MYFAKHDVPNLKVQNCGLCSRGFRRLIHEMFFNRVSWAI